MTTTTTTTTTNIADFGSRERYMLIQLLQAWETQGLPKGFDDDAVVPMLNMDSGNVFLTNSEYQSAMMNGNKLELWHFLPYSGEEGFIGDLMELDPSELHPDDIEYLRHYNKDFGTDV